LSRFFFSSTSTAVQLMPAYKLNKFKAWQSQPMMVLGHSVVATGLLNFLLILFLLSVPHVLALTGPASILRKVAVNTDTPPTALTLTKALSEVSSMRPEDQDWSYALASGSP